MKKVSFLDNPPRGARRATKRRNAPKHAAKKGKSGKKKRNPPQGYKTWGAFMKHLRDLKGGGKRSTTPTHHHRGAPMAKKGKKRANAPKKAKKYSRPRRKNPPMFGMITKHAAGRGPVGFAVRTVGRAVTGLGGEIFVRKVRGSVFKKAPGTIAGTVIEGITGLVSGYLLSLVHEGAGAAWAQGAVAAPMRTELQQLSIPHISDSLGDDGFVMGPGTGVTLISAFPDDYSGVVQGEEGDASLGRYVSGGDAGAGGLGAYVAGNINNAA